MKKAMKKLNRTSESVTEAEYSGLQKAFDFFNAELPFGDRLPNYLITLPRKANSTGYFGPDRFSGRIEKSTVSELALNPDGFTGKTDEQICQTLVHEMVHGWQHAYGTFSRRGYHNKEWAAKMKEVGLYPSSTGMVGGRETGQRMSDYIIPDGPFARAYAKLKATGFELHWQSTVRSKETKPASKVKFTCTSCGQNAWGKPDLEITCTPCGIRMGSSDNANGQADVSPSHVPNPIVAEPAKPKRGRPKGSKNKPKVESYQTKPATKRKRGRAQSYERKAA